MADTNAATTEAARAMARSRWGTRGLDNAVAVVVQRHDELNRDHLAALAAALLDDTDHDERNADDA